MSDNWSVGGFLFCFISIDIQDIQQGMSLDRMTVGNTDKGRQFQSLPPKGMMQILVNFCIMDLYRIVITSGKSCVAGPGEGWGHAVSKFRGQYEHNERR